MHHSTTTPPALRLHTFAEDALAQYDATALAQLISQRALSSMEVVAASVARAQKIEPSIHAIVTPCYGHALGQARRKNTGFFAGVPTFIKDNVDVQALPTLYGSEAVAATPAKHTAPFAKQLLAQGWICLGKSSLPEFGLNASTEFQRKEPTRNPWNTHFSSGASSGGAAALVAAGVVPLAHANDGGGSIRIPAACCGLVGLKPSRGRLIDAVSAKKLPINIVSEGVITRSVRDTAQFYAQAETYFHHPQLPRLGLIHAPSARRLRIGVLEQGLNGKPYDSATATALTQVVQQLEHLQHHVEPASLYLDPRFGNDFSLYWGMLAYSLEKAGARIVGKGFDAHRLDPLTRGLSALFRGQLLHFPTALYRLHKAQKDYAQWFRRFDLILSPTLSYSVPPLGYLSPNVPFDELFQRLTQLISITPINNVTGTPAISLPMAQSADGMPIGMHFCAPWGHEARLLELAFEIELAHPWQRMMQTPT
jgi:amidase